MVNFQYRGIISLRVTIYPNKNVLEDNNIQKKFTIRRSSNGGFQSLRGY